MPTLALRRPNSSRPRYGASALGMVLVLSMMYWVMQIWQWSAPLTTPAPVVLNNPTAAQEAREQWAQLFEPGTLLTNSNNTTNSASQWKLLGIVSAHSGKGIAMLSSPSGEELLARSGENLAPGLVLQQVHDDHVLLGADAQSTHKLSIAATPTN